ncbi:response regulator transcription factor [Streptomyces sp. NPDC005892]|uniref:response regulator transcription factor n=1 Tax=Streptomyces sp. NPDC005892 TaxID=3155593 RepID=UPI0033CF932A
MSAESAPSAGSHRMSSGPYAAQHIPGPAPGPTAPGPTAQGSAVPGPGTAPETPLSPFPPLAESLPPLRVVVADDNPVVRAGLGALLSGRADIEVVAEAVDGRQAWDLTLLHRPDVVLLDVRMPGVDGISALPHLVRISPVLMLTYSRESEIVQEALRLGAIGYLVHGEFTADQLVEAVRGTKHGRAHFTASAADALLAHIRQDDPGRRDLLPDGLGAGMTSETTERGTGSQEPAVMDGRPGQFTDAFEHGATEGLSRLQPLVGQSFSIGRSADASNRHQFGLSSREVEIMELIAAGMSNQQIAATCFISEKTVKNHINRIFTKLHCRTRSEAIARWLGTAPGAGAGHFGGR